MPFESAEALSRHKVACAVLNKLRNLWLWDTPRVSSLNARCCGASVGSSSFGGSGLELRVSWWEIRWRSKVRRVSTCTYAYVDRGIPRELYDRWEHMFMLVNMMRKEDEKGGRGG